MQIHIHIHDHRGHIEQKLDEAIKLIIENNLILKKVMTKEELKAALGNIATQLNKAKDEILAALEASGNVDADTEAAVNQIGTIAQALDDINPDAPAPTP